MQILSPVFSSSFTQDKLCEAMTARSSVTDIANTSSAGFASFTHGNTDCNRKKRNICTKPCAALSAFDQAEINEISLTKRKSFERKLEMLAL